MELKELRERLMAELKHYSKKEMNFTALDTIDKLAHAIKCIDKITEKDMVCHEEEIVETKDETQEVIDYLKRAIVAMQK